MRKILYGMLQSEGCPHHSTRLKIFVCVHCRGHGTRVKQDQLLATVCGIVNRVNKLITVRTLHRRYAAEVGDIVLGRVTEVRFLLVMIYRNQHLLQVKPGFFLNGDVTHLVIEF
jgi:hypothetical protein